MTRSDDRWQPSWEVRVGPHERAAGSFDGAVVAAEQLDAARAGIDVLDAGGNAVDAAVAIAFAACVVQPSATTIAGSGFMLVQPAAGVVPTAIDFPPRAPRAAAPDMFELHGGAGGMDMLGLRRVRGDANVVGALAVGVPAAVAGLCRAHEQFGRLSLQRVMAPAVALADDGFELTPELQLSTVASCRELRAAGASGTLLAADGLPHPLAPGFASLPSCVPLLRQPDLAATLRAIAVEGPRGFYRGHVADRIVSTVRDAGGILTHADLRGYAPIVAPALTHRLGRATVYAPRSPSGAWTELQVLAVLERMPARTRPGAVAAAAHRCFADRYRFLADPEFADVPLGRLLGDRYIARLAREADQRRAWPALESEPWVHYAADASDAADAHAGPIDHHETTHLSVTDDDGMLVSATLTAADSFGSRMLAAGALLDNAMIWFDAAPGHVNSIAGWKRPLANMGPIVVEADDGRRLSLGAPGGRRIMSAVVQVAAAWLGGAALDHATAAPRLDYSGREVIASARLDPSVVEALRADGVPVRWAEDRDPFTYEFARPLGVAIGRDGKREAAVQPFVPGVVAGRRSRA